MVKEYVILQTTNMQVQISNAQFGYPDPEGTAAPATAQWPLVPNQHISGILYRLYVCTILYALSGSQITIKIQYAAERVALKLTEVQLYTAT